ncbi:disulfide bond formation protein DsbB [Shewanella sp. WXL01]|uniref:disulfide bond formation protein DsbB n=1 Tax=Shewanella sp. WXL01 TaxID=2709721 RepID=UPI0014385B46|nr:disulfide bond formation protein DsbB [Shewanella sp. WXL01]NKF51568.1 disulfide bond formation protein DsbB [Shewanella sp. WXL01]
MGFLTRFSQSRQSWTILFISGLALELAAAFFQYVMHLDPCVMCIYIRVAVLGIMAAGLIGMIAPKVWLVRLVGLVTWAVSAAWGLKLANELNEMQVNPNPFSTCSFFAEFPDFMPLDKWMPFFFEPRGMCSDIPWSFMGVTMTQWMMLGFLVYLLTLVLMLIPALKPAAKS